MIKSLMTEYGLPWVLNRTMYSAKLRIMRVLPFTESLFEKEVKIKRINIFDLDVDGIKHFILGLSEEKKNEILEIADKACKGTIAGFSSIELNFGDPINWHYNPITEKESSRSSKWYTIPDFDPERGDIKVIWEASRFTHFYYFVRAFLLTGDKKYYNAFSSQLDQWIKDNSYPYGANFKCGQECSLRMINALMTYTAFNKAGVSTEDDDNNIRKLVTVCYKKIVSNFFYAHKCIQNNHTLSEICGLIIGSWCCENEDEVKRAYKLLDKEILSQFMQDGGYIQFSFNYQRFALQIMECVAKLSTSTNMSLCRDAKYRIRKSVELMYQMQDESGEMPNYGSNDGALIFPVSACSYKDFRPVLNTTNLLFGGGRLYKEDDYDEELLWFGSSIHIRETLFNINKQPSKFAEAGLYSLRHDNGYMMIVLQDYKTRPAQMDQLHIDLWHNMKNVFCDSGTFSYATEIGRKLALTAAHNTVIVDNTEQMNKHGAFMICDWTSTKNVKHTDECFIGTMVSKNGYEHTRQVQKTNDGYMISDLVCGEGESCEVYYHTPYEVRVVPGGIEVVDKGTLICTVTVDTGEISINRSYRSLYYLRKEEINCISIKCTMQNRRCSINTDIKFSRINDL